MEKGIIKEIKEFLKYLAKNARNPEKKSHEELIKKFGKDFFDRVYELSFENGYITNFVHGKGETRYFEILLKPKGLHFLEEETRKEINFWNIINSNALHNILFIVVAVITIFVTIYFNVHQMPYMPNIHLSTNYEKNEVIFMKELGKDYHVDFLLYIYNQGNGACVNMKISYPDFLIPSIRPQKIFRQYTDVRDEIKDNFNSTAILSADNSWRMGILEPNDAVVLDFTRRHDKIQLPNNFKIEVNCNNGFHNEITILNKNPFIVENPLT